jgi:predicted ABC-type ATPase
VVAGPNGCGKTTFAREYQAVHGFPYLSADVIAEEMAPGNIDEVRVRAGRLFLERLAEQIERKDSFIVESTLSGLSFGGMIRKMTNAEYIVTVAFIFLGSAEACVARVYGRVQKGGHPVPVADIVRRYSRSCSNFWHVYRPLVDSWHLFYNGSAHFHEVAVGAGSETDVLDEGLFNRFIQIAGVHRDD